MYFQVNLGHEWTGGVDDAQRITFGGGANFGRHPVSTEDEERTRRDVGRVFDEDGSLRAQILDHVLVVDDLVPNIHGRAKTFERDFDDLDRSVYTRTEASGARDADFYRVHTP